MTRSRLDVARQWSAPNFKELNDVIGVLNGDQETEIFLIDEDENVVFEVRPDNFIEAFIPVLISLNNLVVSASVRYALRLGAQAGSQSTQDSVLLIQNFDSGTGYRFLNGILYGNTHTAIDATSGTLINSEAITVNRGINLSSITFNTAKEMLWLPGVASRTGFKLLSINSTTGIRQTVDLTNNTFISRFMLQAGDADGSSLPGLGVIPSASGVKAGYIAFADDDADNTHYGALIANATDSLVELHSNKNGTGTVRPLSFMTTALERMRVASGGYSVGIGVTASDLTTIAIPSDVGLYICRKGGAASNRSILLDEECGIQMRQGSGTSTGTARDVFYHRYSGGEDYIHIGNSNLSNVRIYSYDDTRILLGAHPGVDVMTIQSSGIKIGLDTLIDATHKLQIRNDGDSASFDFAQMDGSDRIQLGQTSTPIRPLGSLDATQLTAITLPAIDPPTATSQLAAKSVSNGWTNATVAAGTLTERQDYNVTSTARSGAGTYTVTWDRDFADAYYAYSITFQSSSPLMYQVTSQTAGALAFTTYHIVTLIATDVDTLSVIAFGALS